MPDPSWALHRLAVRMNLASQQPGYAKVSFPKFTMKEVAEKGALSVYDGLGAGCTRQIFYATSRFGLFEVFRDKIQEVRGSLGPAERLVAGLTSGACAAMISCPAEVSLVRMSNDSTLPVRPASPTLPLTGHSERCVALAGGAAPQLQQRGQRLHSDREGRRRSYVLARLRPLCAASDAGGHRAGRHV